MRNKTDKTKNKMLKKKKQNAPDSECNEKKIKERKKNGQEQ